MTAVTGVASAANGLIGTDGSFPRTRKDLKVEISTIRETGFARDQGELHPGDPLHRRALADPRAVHVRP